MTVITIEQIEVKVLLRDISSRMVEAWRKSEFGTNDKYKDLVVVCALIRALIM